MAAVIADPSNSSNITGRQIPDLVVPAERISHFAEIDLGKLNSLPHERKDLVALSIRMEAAFNGLCKSALKSVKDIPRGVLETVATEIALDFIERNGLLALFSTTVLGVLWPAQRRDSRFGPKRLREVGKRLAVFAMAARGHRPRKTIDISFKLTKADFVAEIDRLARELGRSESEKPWADQLSQLVRAGEYPMLKLNLTFLEQFLRSQQTNPVLKARNAAAADQLAEYGIGKELGERRGPTLTPDWFFYTWVGWMVNKRPSTVRREIQTAESRFKKTINEQISGYGKSSIS